MGELSTYDSNMNGFQLPFFTALEQSQNVLIAGAGGGFDVFSGLPLYFNLVASGKNVILANYSFSSLPESAGTRVTSSLIEVNQHSVNESSYFPEKYLSAWFAKHGSDVPIYSFMRVGPKSIFEGYQAMVDRHHVDTVILVDGGTDSLMRGDEEGLGTPVEDMSSICAAARLDVPRKFLVCLGFGIESFHGVCHAHVLEAIADMIQSGGYLGAFSLMREMPEAREFINATNYVIDQMPGRESIVCTSIVSAIEGHFGDVHRTSRTGCSKLFINPLMSLYWCFQLDHVARRIEYLEGMRDMTSYADVHEHIEQHRLNQFHRIRKGQTLPI